MVGATAGDAIVLAFFADAALVGFFDDDVLVRLRLIEPCGF